ncbi:MAG: hypothetical protein D6694_08435 [Gammaproteobacteria bacterium]|nr:MAG: hypothetical protein D6694_08435 [Gammaproteobacteria bacterium]
MPTRKNGLKNKCEASDIATGGVEESRVRDICHEQVDNQKNKSRTKLYAFEIGEEGLERFREAVIRELEKFGI